MGKRHREKKHQSQNESPSSLSIEPILALSNRNYNVNYIVSNKQTIGYLGVFADGRFRYSLNQDDMDETEILLSIKTYIREELHLEPIVDPQLS